MEEEVEEVDVALVAVVVEEVVEAEVRRRCAFLLFHVISIEKLTIHQYLYYKLLMIRNAR